MPPKHCGAPSCEMFVGPARRFGVFRVRASEGRLVGSSPPNGDRDTSRRRARAHPTNSAKVRKTRVGTCLFQIQQATQRSSIPIRILLKDCQAKCTADFVLPGAGTLIDKGIDVGLGKLFWGTALATVKTVAKVFTISYDTAAWDQCIQTCKNLDGCE